MVTQKMFSLGPIVVVLGLLSPANSFLCPVKPSCICTEAMDNELNCNIDGQSVVINTLRNKYFHVECDTNGPFDYSKMPNIITDQNSGFQTVSFKGCPLPATSFGEVLSQLGISKTMSMFFQNSQNLSSTLQRKHLKGLEGLSKLLLSSNGLTNLPDDLFEDMKNLTWLNLRSNHIILSQNIFRTLNKLETLEISLNQLKEIPESTFKHLTSLKRLFLWHNHIKNISKDLFQGMDVLEEIDLSSNGLEDLDEEIFYPLKRLKTASLFANNFTSLPSALFSKNKELVTVRLFNNNVNMKSLPEGLLSNMPNLKEAYLYRCGLTMIPETLFLNSSQIINISLADNAIEVLPETLFKDQINLLTLDLSNNKVVNLAPNLFLHTVKLESLRLTKNKIEELPSFIFWELSKLKYLNLEKNNLKKISKDAFGIANKKLETINMAYNQLDLLQEETVSNPIYLDAFGDMSPFKNVQNLKYLNLSHNDVRLIFDDWLKHVEKWEYLDLSFNKFQRISFDDISFLSDKVTLDLRHNEIEEINFGTAETKTQIQNRTFPDAYHIRDQPPHNIKILIEDNPFNCDCIMYYFVAYLYDKLDPQVHSYVNVIPGNSKCASPANLQGTPLNKIHLETLLCPLDDPNDSQQKMCPENCVCSIRMSDRAIVIDCSDHLLSKVPSLPDPSSAKMNYTELHLERCGLKDIVLNNTIPKHVTKLYLNGNNLTNVDLENIPAEVEILDLRNNQIKHVNETMAQTIVNSSSLQRLWISGNPIACDCRNRDFLAILQDQYAKIEDFQELQCPNGFKLATLNVGSLCGTTPALIALSTLVALAGLIVGTTAALYYKYNQEIKVYLFSKGWFLWWVSEDEVDKDKLYDAFVSFSGIDEEFVINNLVSELEKGPNPFKLCVHFRDWIAGEMIPNQITKSVLDSRRTIVVLSPNFIDSVWGRMEFRTAHCQALKEGRARVIVVIYGDIGSTENLDPELQAYLTTNTYLKWGDPWFWDKLRYALPHPKYRSEHISADHNIKKKKGFDDRLELIVPTTPTTPSGQYTPPANQAQTNILMHYVNNVPNGETKYPFPDVNTITMNGLKVNGNAKHSEV